MTPQQRRRAKLLRERRKLVKSYGPNPICVNCGQRADDLHEILSRARGGSITDPNNAIPLCSPCHDWVTTHPKEAEAAGLSIRTGGNRLWPYQHRYRGDRCGFCGRLAAPWAESVGLAVSRWRAG